MRPINRILFIGERDHIPDLPLGRKEELSRAWFDCPVQSILTMLGMTSEREVASRMRLARLLRINDTAAIRVINLLAPDSKRGTWDARVAEANATDLRDTTVFDLVEGTVLLGRRVERAFAAYDGTSIVEFGNHLNIWNQDGLIHRALVLPHPSGLSRVWNSPIAAERMLQAFWRYVDGH